MQQRIWSFANEYDADADRLASRHDGQRRLNHPLVFIFIGDKSIEALNAVYQRNERKWTNHQGVLYFHVYREETIERDNLFSLRLPITDEDPRTIRRELHSTFYRDSAKWIEWNRIVRSMSNRIAESGKLYTSFQRLNMAVVTRIDDPCNILLQEFVLLLRTVLSESFKLIQTDLYGLICEKQTGTDFAYATALGVSFLHELDKVQNKDYQFQGKLLVTEDGIRLPVSYTDAPLFDLVYLLSDKNEQAMFPENGMQTNYDIIGNINMLKNRKIVDEHDQQHENYNNQHYKQHMIPADSTANVYSSAGLARLKRPNAAIALTVIAHLYQRVLDRLMQQGHADKRTILELWQLDGRSLDEKVKELFPDRQQLEGLNGLLAQDISFDELKNLSLRQAEEAMYGQHAEQFFRHNIANGVEVKLGKLDCKRELQETMEQRIVNDPKFGLYCAYLWTSEAEEAIVYDELRGLIRETERQLQEARLKLEQTYREPVHLQTFPRSLFHVGSKVRKFSRHFFTCVYGNKWDIMFLETKLTLLRQYENHFNELHEGLKGQVGKLFELGTLLNGISRKSISEADDYLGRNIPEYYGSVVVEILKDLEEKKGEHFYWEERYFGNVSTHLRNGTEALLQRFIDVCRKEILTYPPFRQSFEAELLQRANVTVRYDEQDLAISKDDLYRDLYMNLDEQAAVHIDLFHYTHKHRYEEKYFFGELESEFIQYALAVDQASRLYKLGCVRDAQNSGMEKLSLMGGFQLSDLMYLKHGVKYYDSYVEGGFLFHAIAVSVMTEGGV